MSRYGAVPPLLTKIFFPHKVNADTLVRFYATSQYELKYDTTWPEGGEATTMGQTGQWQLHRHLSGLMYACRPLVDDPKINCW